MAVDLGNFAPAAILLSRNLFGWVENALQDKTVTWPEVLQLGQTLARMAPVFIFAMFGLQQDPTQAAAIAVGADIVVRKADKVIKARKG